MEREKIPWIQWITQPGYDSQFAMAAMVWALIEIDGLAVYLLIAW